VLIAGGDAALFPSTELLEITRSKLVLVAGSKISQKPSEGVSTKSRPCEENQTDDQGIKHIESAAEQ
jgi:hypothetical protein